MTEKTNACPIAFVAAVTAAIAEGMGQEELAKLGTLLAAVGDQLSLLALCAQPAECDEKRTSQ